MIHSILENKAGVWRGQSSRQLKKYRGKDSLNADRCHGHGQGAVRKSQLGKEVKEPKETR